MENALVVSHNLTKNYPSQKDVYAIRSLDLNIEGGTLFGLIGPDGAGLFRAHFS